jgi:phage shock protein PspC (stress-responsive transcriptional regulator)
MVAGVCAGIGEYFNIDPTLVRLGFVLGTFLGLGSLFIAYIILMIIVPEEPASYSPVPPPPASPITSPASPSEPEVTDSGESPSI